MIAPVRSWLVWAPASSTEEIVVHQISNALHREVGRRVLLHLSSKKKSPLQTLLGNPITAATGFSDFREGRQHPESSR